MNPYDPKKIEKKWQKVWEEEETFKFEDPSTGSGQEKPKAYILDMFPYPSSAGLHVGHPEGYTATDIICRHLRMDGVNILHPMGWDAFGLPAENYAVKTGVHPTETTKKSINRFREQIKSIGLSYDWSREISTADPRYYKWTQWLFLYLFKRGLAYRAEAPVNWCPSCQTVLANEQVVNGECERCGSKVVQKNLAQWFFKITDYADRLLNNLETLDWPENIKSLQRNWIGRSEGAELEFRIQSSEYKIKVFTTRPDTLFGSTYLVLAPEHELLRNRELRIKNSEEVRSYVEQAAGKTELERQAETKDKTGVRLEGVVAVNPANEKEIPIFVADYVLGRYGTGAIMAVPAHDSRDWEFAKKFDLPTPRVIIGEDLPYVGEGELTNSGEFDGMSSQGARGAITKFVGGEKKVQYRLRDWLVSRQRYWGAPIPIVYCGKCGIVPVPEKDLPVELPLDVEFLPKGESPLARSDSFTQTKCPKCGENARREVDTMDTFVDSSWYFLRYLDPENTKEIFDEAKIKKAMPVDLYVGGAEHAVLHLLYSRFIYKALFEGKLVPGEEPFLKLRNQGLILGPDGQRMSKSKGNVVNPDDVVADYGADAFRMYEMFMGPFADAKPWDTRGIVGVFRFLTRVHKFGENVEESISESKELRVFTHQTIRKVKNDILGFSFNTAVSSLMILFNKIEEEKSNLAFRTFLLLLYPFAPHLAAELWEKLGFGKYIWEEQWPQAEEQYLVAEEVPIVVQVNGKLRDTIMLPADMSEEEVKRAATSSLNVQKHLEGKEIIKTIVVPGRLVNFVVK